MKGIIEKFNLLWKKSQFNVTRTVGGTIIEYEGYSFSQRELEILSLKADGLAENQIAKRLGITRHGVKSALEDLRTRNRNDYTSDQLVIAAERLQLLYPSSLAEIDYITKNGNQ